MTTNHSQTCNRICSHSLWWCIMHHASWLNGCQSDMDKRWLMHHRLLATSPVSPYASCNNKHSEVWGRVPHVQQYSDHCYVTLSNMQMQWSDVEVWWLRLQCWTNYAFYCLVWIMFQESGNSRRNPSFAILYLMYIIHCPLLKSTEEQKH